MKYYTGVGARKTPEHIQRQMASYAVALAQRGYVLRSGAAEGADSAFEEGCETAGGLKEIYIPWPGFENRDKYEPGVYALDDMEFGQVLSAVTLAKAIHPNWKRLTRGGRKLHTRNIFQVLGLDTKTPSKFMICWTPGGRVTGGMATAIKLAQESKVRVYNLGTVRGEILLDKHISEGRI